jgi:hypothetical protein
MAISSPISPALGWPRTGRDHGLRPRCNVRPWRVLHLFDEIGGVAPMLELQLAAGMRPRACTPSGPAEPTAWITANRAASTPSLLTAWREVRTWRHWITKSDGHCDLVHAHSFSAGMAAARAGAPLVYDIRKFVEQQTGPEDRAHSPNPGAPQSPWVARSFRAAEQFVIQRAAAVIVHSSAVYRGALQRGARSADLFVLAELACAPDVELESAWLRSLAERYDAVYGHVFSSRKSGRNPLFPPGWQPLAVCL